MSGTEGGREEKGGFPFRTSLLAIVAVGLAVNLAIWFWPTRDSAPPAYPTYPEQVVSLGEVIFRSNCATCHGAEGAGNPQKGVPALDGSMHAWHHGDGQIAGFLRQGVQRMPAVGADWSDEEVTAVLAYVKQWWSPDQRAYQAEVSRKEP